MAKLGADTFGGFLHPTNVHHALHLRLFPYTLHPQSAQEKADVETQRGCQRMGRG